MKPPKPLPKISRKKLAALGGQMPFSSISRSITSERKPTSKSGKPRRNAIKRSAKVKPVNSARRKREWVRAYGSPERVTFVASLPCVVQGCRVTPCENAHTSGDGGAGRKASARYIVPCCTPHHREQHEHGAGTFALKYSLNLRALASATEAAWRSTRSET